jgi:hypothetical protein
MRMTKTTEITIETERIVSITRRCQAASGWCPTCDREIMMITAPEAAEVLGISRRGMFQAVELGHLHAVELSDQLMICLVSLVRMQSRKK